MKTTGMKKVYQQLGALLLVSALLLVGCEAKVDESKEILSIWKIGSSTINGIEIGDGKGWLHFKDNGIVESRTGPQLYDSGNFRINPEAKTIEMYTDTTNQVYNYVMNGDSLTMKAHIGEMPLVLRTVKVNEYPIKRIDDVPENFPRP